MPSTRTRRPSASVSTHSTVCPAKVRTMSPGLMDLPEGMFSAAGTTARTRRSGLSCATARTAPRAAAPRLFEYLGGGRAPSGGPARPAPPVGLARAAARGGAEGGAPPRHVGLHLVHVEAVLDGDAARVERDALADEGPQLAVFARA